MHDLQIAQSVSADQRTLTHGSVFQIVATAKPGNSAEELETAIERVIERMAEEGPGDEELQAAKVSTLAVTVKSLEPSDAVADRLNAYNHYFGDPDQLQADLDRFDDSGGRDIRRFVAGNLTRDRRVVVHVNPGPKILPHDPPAPPPPPVAETEARPEPKESWRSQVPAASDAPEVRLPVPDFMELENGLGVYLVRRPELPLVTVQLTARSGSSSEPAELPGLASFTAEMLNEGAGDRSTLEIANSVTALGSTLETGSSREASWVTAQVLKPNLGATVEIMGDVVLRPNFPDAEMERVRGERLASLQQQRDRPLTAAFKVMWREHYGAAHPYGRLGLGTERGIRDVRREDLAQAHRRTFSPGNSVLILTGDLDLEEARSLAEDTFGDWEGGSDGTTSPPPPVSSLERVLLIDRPGSPQTTLVLAQPGLARDDPDWSTLQLVNQVLGGLFSSRLNQVLRETSGSTYGVNSEITQGREPGLLYVSMSVDPARTRSAVEQAIGELGRLRDAGITQEELDEARQAVLRSLPSLFRTNGSTAGTVAHLYALGLPQAYYRRLNDRLSAVSLADAAQVANRYLRPDAVKVIAVGDRARTEGQLLDLQLGEVAFRTFDGTPP
ncbi:hypothetical protein BH23ACT12_BH23ACT12_23180 [soil metagenome]